MADERLIKPDADGFCISLRQVEPITLQHHIQVWRSDLEVQRKTLAARIEKLKFNTVDALITIVMPGGLLYATVKRTKQTQRRQNLNLLTQDIEQLTGDLHTLGSIYPETQIAALD